MNEKKQQIFTCLAQCLGNGNLKAGTALAYALMARMNKARAKHRVFAAGAAHALGAVGSEYAEFEHAVLKETPDRQRDEALDLAVTALRFLNGEHLEASTEGSDK